MIFLYQFRLINLYLIDKEQSDGSIIPINSFSSCLEILTQCHRTIIEQDASRFFFKFEFFNLKQKTILFLSSSDSDSDPEGGELPEIAFRKDGTITKKKSKKKRPEKIIEERNQKLNRKRQVNIVLFSLSLDYHIFLLLI